MSPFVDKVFAELLRLNRTVKWMPALLLAKRKAAWLEREWAGGGCRAALGRRWAVTGLFLRRPGSPNRTWHVLY